MNLTGEWINQNGSTVELSEAADGALAGFYCSRKGRSASGKRYPLFGRVNDEVLTFYVNWADDDDNLHSITSFVGRRGTNPDGQDIIHTMWHLVRQWENEERTRPTGAWNAFLTNSDVFVRIDQQT